VPPIFFIAKNDLYNISLLNGVIYLTLQEFFTPVFLNCIGNIGYFVKKTLKIKKQSIQTTGYQIQYSTSKKFSSSKTKMISKNKTLSKTVSKLKKKKVYYVRVRTYKKIGSKKYYSGW